MSVTDLIRAIEIDKNIQHISIISWKTAMLDVQITPIYKDKRVYVRKNTVITSAFFC